MKKRVFLSIFFAAFLTLAITAALAVGLLYYNSSKSIRKELAAEAFYIGKAYESSANSIGYISEIGKGGANRITIVSPDGTVIYDNYASPEKMENHLSRPEISSAIANGKGESTRLSDTLGSKNYYYAVRLENGGVLRVSAAAKSLFGEIRDSVSWVIAILVFTLLIAVFIARLLTQAIISPINSLNLDAPLSNKEYEELSPLLLRMDKQNQRIKRQLEELSSKKKELEYITDSMSEAMVIFGRSGAVLSCNRSARRLFDIYEGASYLRLSRDIGYIGAVEKALGGTPETVTMNISGRIYQLSVSPVQIEHEDYAAVLFAMDITEKEENEKMRREFSANVSHELKTPLTSIMGYAEIIQNGIARAGDIPNFAGRIRSEASRLLNLIEDIMKLSMLDEKTLNNEFAGVDLLSLAESVCDELTLKAKERNVTISVDGTNVSVRGISSTLHEMLFNLCDNAISYNKAGGSVRVSVAKEVGRAVLTVSDTGVGIAPEHQERIFERFYRVDKSHSKETGGTGLGLSIVKHGAKLHGAEIRLESRVGEGTKISLIFKADT